VEDHPGEMAFVESGNGLKPEKLKARPG
jgi:hypothetical protein